MGFRGKWQLMIGFFAFCWMLYFAFPCFGQGLCFASISNPFDTEVLNLVFLMVLFVTVSVLAADGADYLISFIRRMPWFRPRLGEVLVSRGFITEEELSDALAEQNLRIGEVLNRSGKVSDDELAQADAYRRTHVGIRMGDALVKLGYISEKDLAWALDRVNRKLGAVLIERGLISEADLHRTLSRMWYSRLYGQ